MILAASYGFQGLVMLSGSSFNGLNKPIPSAVFSILRTLVVYLPIAWIGSRIFGINGVFWGGFISNILIGVISMRYLKKTVKNMEISAEIV
jgi:Na+-driven multidrug efflux pump